MGCSRSVALETELKSVTTQVESLQKEDKNKSTQIRELQREVEKAKKDALTLIEENQKLTYQIHCRRNEEGYEQLLNAQFESNKEEFKKVRVWSVFEIEQANAVLVKLVNHCDWPASDERRTRISFLLQSLTSNEYDMEHLLSLSQQRYEYIHSLLDAIITLKENIKEQMKPLEHIFQSALKQVENPKAAEFVKTLAGLEMLEKAEVFRKVIKTFGLGEATAGVRDEDKEMELEGEIVNLKNEINTLASEITRLKSIIQDYEQNQVYEDDVSMSAEEREPTPAPTELTPPSPPVKTFKRRVTSFNVSSYNQIKDLESLHDHISPELYALGLELKKTKDTLSAYEENMPEIRAAARLVREKGSKEATLKLLIWIETLVESIKAVGAPANQYIL